MTPEADHAAFEAWHKRKFPSCDFTRESDDCYRFGLVTLLYQSFLAGLAHARATPNEASEGYQDRINAWMLECFGPAITADRMERNHRFFEEATELVQANGMTASEARQLIDYVFHRPLGDIGQEVGGVMVTLAALCNAGDIDLMSEAETEHKRITQPNMLLKIRAKQAAKPKHSPLPQEAERVRIEEVREKGGMTDGHDQNVAAVDNELATVCPSVRRKAIVALLDAKDAEIAAECERNDRLSEEIMALREDIERARTEGWNAAIEVCDGAAHDATIAATRELKDPLVKAIRQAIAALYKPTPSGEQT